jgi:hypothetical protein
MPKWWHGSGPRWERRDRPGPTLNEQPPGALFPCVPGDHCGPDR